MENGIINVYKEKGFTSFDVVAKMRGIIGQKKIGHTGTLDPDAEGVLPVCLGNATKICDLLTDKTKEYVAELLLGVETDTQDITGTVLSTKDVQVTQEQVVETIMSFLGEYDQVPPMYSALKVNGRKLVDLAREGIEVERKARRIHIYELEILKVDLPVVKMRVHCSKGTYIRTLCHDIGQKLGCGGTMKSLLRSRVDQFCVEDALTLSQLQQRKAENRLKECILSVDCMFPDLKKLHVKEEYLKALQNGNRLSKKCFKEKDIVSEDKEEVLVYNSENVFYAIYAYLEQDHNYKIVKMFLPE